MRSFDKKMRREKEKTTLKKRINELLGLLNLSKRAWKKMDVRVEGKGLNVSIPQTYFQPGDKVKWGRHKKGHKPSLKNQYAILWDLWEERVKNQKMIEELKKQMDKVKPEQAEG